MNRIVRARALRRRETAAERRLWNALRRRELRGCKFRRQHPLGEYVVDFACPETGLVVEVDGGQHAGRGAADAARTRALQSRGYRVLRFWNNEVHANLEGVLQRIAEAIDQRR